ncbi:MAG TPA: DUF6599 family protein, partial [Pyrinomonadaceae bacterium]|nr:DUF6599 family protein [Pyrinomonadaceae bacterium]
MRLFRKMVCLLAVLLWLTAVVVAEVPDPHAIDPNVAKSLPDNVGEFRPRTTPVIHEDTRAAELPPSSTVKRTYVDSHNVIFEVFLARTRNDSSAYSLLTLVKGTAGEEIKLGTIGTANINTPGLVRFVKGNAFVELTSQFGSQAELVQLANGIAEQLDDGDGDIPVLVRHLPSWESSQPHAEYAVTFDGLKHLFPNRKVLEAIEFDSGPEAVKADYGAGRLLIIEFNTPQVSADNERHIAARINELKSSGEPANMLPAAYRRVGNYLVLVFDAPSEQVANELIDQVKYQQVVSWLGDDPYAYERATRDFTETTLGVFVSVVKASGLALVTCFAVGGL